MRRKPTEMPLVLALLASAVIHAAALIGSGWALPEISEPEVPTTIEAVLARPAPRPEAAPVVRPKAPAEKPRPQAVASAPAMPNAPAADPNPTETRAKPPEPPPAAAPAPAPVIEPAAPTPARTALPGKGRQRYVITRGEGGFVIGHAVNSWEHDGFTYTLKNLTETTGLAAVFKPAQALQISRGEVTAEGLRPREFRHERMAGIDTASFDWVRLVVAYAGREDAIAEGTQDMLSMYYQLVLLAPRSGAVEMPIATGRKLENYRFEVIGEETLSLPAGERRAVRLRTRSGNDNIEIWLPVGDGAAARGMPLRIRFTDRKGEIYDQTADDPPSAESL